MLWKQEGDRRRLTIACGNVDSVDEVWQPSSLYQRPNDNWKTGRHYHWNFTAAPRRRSVSRGRNIVSKLNNTTRPYAAATYVTASIMISLLSRARPRLASFFSGSKKEIH